MPDIEPPEAEPIPRGTPADWYTIDTIRSVWGTAEDIPDTLLDELLYVARESVLAFAPPLPPEMEAAGQCPVEYRMAQLMQTRNLWNAVEVDPGGVFGDDTYQIAPKPLDWIVKQMLRPRTAVPVAL